MDAKKREKLESAGWKVGDIDEFLGLSDEEMKIVGQLVVTFHSESTPL